MRKVLSIISIFCAVGIFAQTVVAQESVLITDAGEVDLIIEEVLDQIEKSLDPADTAGDKLSLDPKILDGKELEPEEKLPALPREEVQGDFSKEPESLDNAESIDEEATEFVGEKIRKAEIADEAPEIQDAGSEDFREVKIIPIMHAEASGLIDMLQQMKSPDGEINYSEEEGAVTLKDLPEKLESMSAFIKEVDIPLETAIFAFEYILAEDVVEEIGEALTERIGQIQFNEEENSVVVTDTPVKIGEIRELVKKLDRYNVGIMIETRVLQIILNDEHLEGVDWEAIVSDYKPLPLSEAGGQDVKPFSVGTVSREDYQILIEALDTVGAVRTVSEEQVKGDNETTRTVNGFTTSGIDEAAGIRVTTSAMKNKPFEILIQTQSKNNEGVRIKMDDGATIVIGSSFEQVRVPSTWKIPLLGDLPLLGFVFRNEGERARKAENIIFLTVKSIPKSTL